MGHLGRRDYVVIRRIVGQFPTSPQVASYVVPSRPESRVGKPRAGEANRISPRCQQSMREPGPSQGAERLAERVRPSILPHVPSTSNAAPAASGVWAVFARPEDGVATCQRSNRRSRPQEPPGPQRRDRGVRVWEALETTFEPIPRHRGAETTRNRARADRSSVCQLRPRPPPLPEEILAENQFAVKAPRRNPSLPACRLCQY
ncbi:uncharacterized protein LY79DRAFT_682957 [Colletotrichum navitas]|uniref:Uncharacterized protein n=1 Tax=Colletotrichum navitas TaxID=681940 RepID=A0AAD8Q2W8_9PEZI|nr:uncharacterized protein LY79DRAFT_682957 [Colletotrichum navitas]KAK1594508.1 hypothetical protein LY79DRAFT_682957 [Colletotrichum navitas]